MSYIETYKQLAQPPKWALKQIQAGRLKGKTDINPQWRYQAMTEQFGPCGIGWKYEIERLWNESGPDAQVFAFAEIKLYIKQGDEWSAPIPGIGGHMLVPKESKGLYANDEAYKMAVTDALSTAMKMLGVAADIYSGSWDGSKYRDNGNGKTQQSQSQQAPQEPKKPTKKQAYAALQETAKQYECDDHKLQQIAEWYRTGNKITVGELMALTADFENQLAKFDAKAPIEPASSAAEKSVYVQFDELQKADSAAIQVCMEELGFSNEPAAETDLQKIINKYYELQAA